MRLAKAEKRFSQCSLLQRSLEELRIITEGLPTVREIEDEIRYGAPGSPPVSQDVRHREEHARLSPLHATVCNAAPYYGRSI